MTTITQKKNYKTPHCVFISLEEEACVLAGSQTSSAEEELKDKEPIVFGLSQSNYSSQSGGNSIWDTASSFD